MYRLCLLIFGWNISLYRNFGNANFDFIAHYCMNIKHVIGRKILFIINLVFIYLLMEIRLYYFRRCDMCNSN